MNKISTNPRQVLKYQRTGQKDQSMERILSGEFRAEAHYRKFGMGVAAVGALCCHPECRLDRRGNAPPIRKACGESTPLFEVPVYVGRKEDFLTHRLVTEGSLFGPRQTLKYLLAHLQPDTC